MVTDDNTDYNETDDYNHSHNKDDDDTNKLLYKFFVYFQIH